MKSIAVGRGPAMLEMHVVPDPQRQRPGAAGDGGARRGESGCGGNVITDGKEIVRSLITA